MKVVDGLETFELFQIKVKVELSILSGVLESFLNPQFANDSESERMYIFLSPEEYFRNRKKMWDEVAQSLTFRPYPFPLHAGWTWSYCFTCADDHHGVLEFVELDLKPFFTITQWVKGGGRKFFLAVHRQHNRTLCLSVRLSEPTKIPFDFDIKEQSQRLVTFETFDQSDQKT